MSQCDEMTTVDMFSDYSCDLIYCLFNLVVNFSIMNHAWSEQTGSSNTPREIIITHFAFIYKATSKLLSTRLTYLIYCLYTTAEWINYNY